MPKEKAFGTDYQALAHHYVYGGEGYNYGYRMFTDGNKIYSYGKHYCIAERFETITGDTVYLFNAFSNSPTTNKQRNCVEHAIPYRDTLIVVPYLGGELNHQNNINWLIEKIKHFLNKSIAPRTRNREEYAQTAQNYFEDFKTYVNTFTNVRNPYNARKRLLKLSDLTKAQRELYDSETLEAFNGSVSQVLKSAETRKKRALTAQRKRELKKHLEAVKKWKSGKLNRFYTKFGEDYLRLSEDKKEVETSQGIKISLPQAKAIYLIIKRTVAKGETVKPENLTVNHTYKVSEIAKDGNLTVGCHFIKYPEIQEIAKALNW